MGNPWIRFGCFLTGYNYSIVRNSSEVVAKAVKRYTSAMLIVCIIWAFIGYTFTKRYLHGNLWGTILGAAILIIIIIQIERQIILAIKPGKLLYISRGIIAGMMAIIGAIIIDQIIFKEDIELEKITSIQKRVKDALPPKTEELRSQISKLDTVIMNKEKERLAMNADISKHPAIIVYSTIQSIKIDKMTTIDSATGKPVTTEKTNPVSVPTSSNIANPNIVRVAALEQEIDTLRSQKTEREKSLLNIRAELENNISSKVGFLDELEVMYQLVTNSTVALIVWLMWFFLLFGLEMLVLISKVNENEDDYRKTVMHQMNVRNRRLDLLSTSSVT
jgi:hypothetical protein